MSKASKRMHDLRTLSVHEERTILDISGLSRYLSLLYLRTGCPFENDDSQPTTIVHGKCSRHILIKAVCLLAFHTEPIIVLITIVCFIVDLRPLTNLQTIASPSDPVSGQLQVFGLATYSPQASCRVASAASPTHHWSFGRFVVNGR